MSTTALSRRCTAITLACGVVATTTTAFAATYNYVDWTTADVAGGTASGTIALAGDAGITVTFVATTADGGPGDLYGAQTGGSGTNYWTPAATYQSAAVENAPPTTDILQLAGGENETYTVTLSEPVVDPIMAIVSLGAGGSPITYNFDSPFTIVSQGTDIWGGTSTSLVQLPNNVLQGAEGSGVIQFIGTYATFSWSAPLPESWHGFTFGVLTSAALYDGGGPDGSDVVIGEDGGIVAPADAGTTDAGGADSGSVVTADAGASVDAGAADAESAADATVADAAIADAAIADATVPDAAVADAAGPVAVTGHDAEVFEAGAGTTPHDQSSNCSCRAAGSGGNRGLAALAALLGAMAIVRRRRSQAR
jgi:MYXO-CTERM domain-containing protein